MTYTQIVLEDALTRFEDEGYRCIAPFYRKALTWAVRAVTANTWHNETGIDEAVDCILSGMYNDEVNDNDVRNKRKHIVSVIKNSEFMMKRMNIMLEELNFIILSEKDN